MSVNYWAKFEEGRFYHIYNRSIGNDILFYRAKNNYFFMAKWKKLISPYLDVAAYCLMSNHFHFLARVKPTSKEVIDCIKQEKTKAAKNYMNEEIDYNAFLESQFKRLYSSYALAINKQEGRHGSLFQKRFKRIKVRSESKFWYYLKYIHHNPIHHGFCHSYSDWKFSSFNNYSNLGSGFLIIKEVLGWVNEEPAKALEIFIREHDEFKELKENKNVW